MFDSVTPIEHPSHRDDHIPQDLSFKFRPRTNVQRVEKPNSGFPVITQRYKCVGPVRTYGKIECLVHMADSVHGFIYLRTAIRIWRSG